MKNSSQNSNSSLGNDVQLTPAQESILTKKYLKVKRDIENGKGFIIKNANEFIRQLNKN